MQNFGVPPLLCGSTGLVTWGLTISMLLGLLVGCWTVVASPLPCLWSRMGIRLHMILAREVDTVKVTKVKGHATEDDVDQGRVREENREG